ncbi:MAG: hypothetical protein ABI639_08280 [Thermoanaerobaculia bacterium]
MLVLFAAAASRIVKSAGFGIVCAIVSTFVAGFATAAPLRAGDGVLDPTFANGAGVRPIAVDLGGDLADRCGDVAARIDGLLMAGGTSTGALGNHDWQVTFLSPDASTAQARSFAFNAGGSLTDTLGAVAFDAAGRPLLAGSAANSDRTELRVCRLTADTLVNDPSWNAGSCLAYDLGAGTAMTVARILEAPDGGLLVAGTLTQPTVPTTDENWYVLKLTSTGGIDGGFGFFGVRVLAWNSVTHGTDRLSDMAVDRRTGTIFLAGSVEGSSEFAGLLARVTPSGNLDINWGNFGGYVDLWLRDGAFVLSSAAQAIALDPATGVIWVALRANSPTGTQLGITGVTANAGLSEVGEFGWVAGTFSTISRLVRQSDGRLLAAGSTADGAIFEVTRFVPFSGTFANPDPTFGAAGTAAFNPGASGWGDGRTLCSAALSAGRPVTFGDSDRPDRDQLVMRWANALIFADGFETSDRLEWSSFPP